MKSMVFFLGSEARGKSLPLGGDEKDVYIK
jgi:hypothetical protein